MRPRQRRLRPVVVLPSTKELPRNHYGGASATDSIAMTASSSSSSSSSSLSFFGAAISPRRRWRRQRNNDSIANSRLHDDDDMPLLQDNYQQQRRAYAGWWSEASDEAELSSELLAKMTTTTATAAATMAKTVNGDDTEADDDEDVIAVLLRFSRWYDETPFSFCGSLNDDLSVSWPTKGGICQEALSRDDSKVFSIDDAASQPQQTRQSSRRISWADHSGHALESIYMVDCSHNSFCNNNNSNTILDKYIRRVCVLLLAPDEKKYEFICCSYLLQDRLSIHQVLDKLPTLATNACLASQQYVSLCHRDGIIGNDSSGGGNSSSNNKDADTNRHADTSDATTSFSNKLFGTCMMELLNTTFLQDFELHPRDVLWAVPDGCLPKLLAPIVNTLLSSKRLQRAVRFSGFATNHPAHLLVSPTPPHIDLPQDEAEEMAELAASWLQHQQENAATNDPQAAGGYAKIDAFLQNESIDSMSHLTTPLEQLSALFSSTSRTCHSSTGLSVVDGVNNVKQVAAPVTTADTLLHDEMMLPPSPLSRTSNILLHDFHSQRDRRESRDDDQDCSGSSSSSDSADALFLL